MADLFDLRSSPVWVDHVTLAVRDIDRMTRFYQDAIGLRVLRDAGGTVALGTAQPLVVLEEDRALKPGDPTEAGLFHTAFLLPGRADLGSWLARAQASGVALTGAADHGVSEALYLDDPEGNGIEIYRDREPADWPVAPEGLRMGNRRMDLRALAETGQSEWHGQPDETFIGHLHLQVGDTATAEGFVTQALGMEVTQRMPQASFFGAGGYHHQIACNTWNSAGAGQRAEDRAGLRRAALRLTSITAAQQLADPWGTRLDLLPATT